MSEPRAEHQESYRPTRPNVTINQSVILAQRLFSFQISQETSSDIKELESYEDRNFLLKGTLQDSTQDDIKHERYFVLKVRNSHASKNRDLLTVAADLLPLISSKSIQCPVPQTSIFGTKSVLCRIFEPESRSSLVKDHASSKEISKGIKVASKEEENFDDVCAVQLMSFVYGDLLCDVHWTKELLVDFGCKMGRLHKILQEYSLANSWIATARLQHPERPWTITNIPKVIRKYRSKLKDTQREAHVQDIAKRFQNEVLEHLKPRDLQLIHTDLNEHNVIVGPNPNGQMEVKGFIDFNDMQYSYRLLCVGVALAYLMAEARKKSFDVVQACGHLLAGYQSEFAVEESDMGKLLVTAKARICQSLVLGAHQFQIDPDNIYLTYTHKAGWEVLESLKLIPDSEIVESWKKILHDGI